MAKQPPLKIGDTDCPGCGAVLDLKVNSKGSVYAYCLQKVGEGEKCFYRASFGRMKSRELINAFMQSQPAATIPTPEKKEPDNVEVTHDEPINHTGHDDAQPAPEPRSGGFISNILGSLSGF